MRKRLKLRNSKWCLHGTDVFVCIFSQYKVPPPKGYRFQFVAKKGRGAVCSLRINKKRSYCKKLERVQKIEEADSSKMLVNTKCQTTWSHRTGWCSSYASDSHSGGALV